MNDRAVILNAVFAVARPMYELFGQLLQQRDYEWVSWSQRARVYVCELSHSAGRRGLLGLASSGMGETETDTSYDTPIMRSAMYFCITYHIEKHK